MQSGLRGGLRRGLRLLFPPQCISCGGAVAEEFGLCPDCWRDTGFIRGLACDKCGTPLPGEADGRAEFCDDCLTIARPWDRGRAVLVYRDTGRRLVLALKHGDRQDLARPLAGWLAASAAPILLPGMLVTPIPLHWRRFLKRRFNQSALLSGALARLAGLDHCPDLLQRTRATPSQEGRGRHERFENMAEAIRVNPARGARLAGRSVLIVDDVMTSGATFAAAADALQAAGAGSVSILALARVAKDG
ncbi:double zinc ribbon domain-containing protein [Frigidibacter sp.]|uniref:double zinc ribbon domain-containing protein n=1 Tax=Frigidibacter sp. TaxID=2586418 RepID=UPI0027344752|nr:double zinc ribbon domain-containing protein [Frigidibacter sp.]MDP3339372.1 double zinc ribbon domain-containing protein [Frigidibacter sp.]